ncbi:MAG: dihydroorotate dehydrogenase electron transfer subunit [Dehalococcoidia bacterium]
MKQIKGKVLYNKELLSYQRASFFLMHVRSPGLALGGKPGQFFMLQCGGDMVLRRPISIHTVNGFDIISLLIAPPIDGRLAHKSGARQLCDLREGDELDLIGPLGNGFNIGSTSKNILIVAGGIGIAPLKFLAETALSSGRGVKLLIGARTKSGLYPQSLLPKGADMVFTTDDGSYGKKGPVCDLIPEYLNDVDQVFACGPQAMYETMQRHMNSWPVEKPVQVSLEVRMGCGVGACYSCSIRTRQGIKRVCKEGPVFDINDIIWQEVRI